MFRLLLLIFLSFNCMDLWARSKSVQLEDYFMELSFSLGLNLPYDLWGTPGSMSSLGIRSSLSISDPGALTAAITYHHYLGDRAYTVDAGYRHEIGFQHLLAYFDIGGHYSKFELDIDRDSSGNCVPANCLTDSGYHYGLYVGTGLAIPLDSNIPLRLGFRYYYNPQVWLFLEANLGIRF